MASNRDVYVSPLVERNASREMSELFGAQKKFSTWRRLWLELASAQKKLGLDIKQTQIDQMAKNLDNIDFQKAAKYEKKFRHDVMAHVHLEIRRLGRRAAALTTFAPEPSDSSDEVGLEAGGDG